APARMSSAISRSSTSRAIGPTTLRSVSASAPGGGGRCPRCGTTPQLGLSPQVPHQFDGTRIDPAMSLPNSSAVRPAASAAADPPDDPPVLRVVSHGLLVVPKIGLNVCQSPASFGVLVLPKITAPASRSRRTASASRSGTWSQASRPQVVRMPAVSYVSLIVIGTPCSG